jgi:hypothetical protein
MPDHNEKKGPMKHQTEKPEPLGAAIDRTLFGHVHTNIAEKGTEKKYFQKHPGDDPPDVRGIIDGIGFDPGERLLLAAGRGNAERDRRFGPQEDTPDKADEENYYGDKRQNVRQEAG